MNKNKALILVFILMLASCTANPVPLVTSTSTNIPIYPPTSNPITLLPATPPKATSTPTFASTPTPVLPSPTPTVSIDPHLKFDHIDALTKIPEDWKGEGSWVMVSPNHFQQDVANVYKKSQITLWNIETGEKQDLLQEGEYVSEVSVSPDHQWLAYTTIKPDNQNKNKSLTIQSTNGQVVKVIPWGQDWATLANWLNNQHLVITRASGEVEVAPIAFLVLNPFTEDQEVLPSKPEDLFNLNFVSWRGEGSVSYNPSLTYRVYPNKKHELALEDIQTHQTVTHFPAPIVDAYPLWSLDGRQFIIASIPNYSFADFTGFELYAITTGGQISQLTYLTSRYPYAYIPTYSLSPDGQKLAFFFSTDPERAHFYGNLAILDMQTHEVTIYDFLAFGLGPWSPDGQELLVDRFNNNYVTGGEIEVVNLVQKWAAPVTKNTAFLGWLSSP